LPTPREVHEPKADSLPLLGLLLVALCTPPAVIFRYLKKDFFEIPALIGVGVTSIVLCGYLAVRLRVWEPFWVFFFDDHVALYNIFTHFAFKHLRLPVGGRKVYYREIRRLGCAWGNYCVMAVDAGAEGYRRVLVQCADEKSAEALAKQVRKYAPSATALDAPSG